MHVSIIYFLVLAKKVCTEETIASKILEPSVS